MLRHPPRPACASCDSFEWDTVTSSGRGTVFSYVVVHHPQIPGFDYPLPIAVVELEEGTRLVGDLIGVDAADVRIGMPVVVEMVAVDDELTIPMFRPVDWGEGGLMDFDFTEEQQAVSEAAAAIFDGMASRRARRRRSRTPTTASTPRCGRSWPRPTCSAWPSPRPTAGRAWV